MSDIYSMTGYSRTQTKGDWGNASCEIRTINHRYLEISIFLPEVLRSLDTELREMIRKNLNRGKIDCSFKFQSAESVNNENIINQSLLNSLLFANEKISQQIKNPSPINTIEILKWPGILQMGEVELVTLKKGFHQLMQQCLDELKQVRAREGNEIRNIFFQRLDQMQQEVSKVKERLPHILQNQNDKLINRFQEAKLELNADRLEQEMVLFAQRIDVSEEVDRLTTHINEVRRILKNGGVIGRRLDFLMQELNREANTLGSKSVDAQTSSVAIELKVLIEQMREQIQNLE